MNEITRKMVEDISSSSFWEKTNTLEKIQEFEEDGADMHVWGDYVLCVAAHNLDSKCMDYLIKKCGLSLTQTFDGLFDNSKESIMYDFINSRYGYNAICSLVSNKDLEPEEAEDIIISVFDAFDIKDDNAYFDAWSTLFFEKEYASDKIESMINKDATINFESIIYNSIDCAEFKASFVKEICDKFPNFVKDGYLDKTLSNLYEINLKETWIDFCYDAESDEKTIFDIIRDYVLPGELTDNIYLKLGKAFFDNACCNREAHNDNTRDEILIFLDALYNEEEKNTKCVHQLGKESTIKFNSSNGKLCCSLCGKIFSMSELVFEEPDREDE